MKVSDAVLRRAVVLSERYITDRFLPDKAIDLLDEACAATALANKQADEYARLTAHVQELEERIERQIVVSKTLRGSTVAIV